MFIYGSSLNVTYFFLHAGKDNFPSVLKILVSSQKIALKYYFEFSLKTFCRLLSTKVVSMPPAFSTSKPQQVTFDKFSTEVFI